MAAIWAVCTSGACTVEYEEMANAHVQLSFSQMETGIG
jgi:hypothetical protein